MDPRNTEQRRNNGRTTWLTRDEVAFVQHLGTHTERGVKTARLVHLQRYLEAASRHHEWGKIDKAAEVVGSREMLSERCRD